MDEILKAINPKVYFGINVKIKNNKKVLTPPNNWVNLTKPHYNNESNIGILCGEVNDFLVIDLDNKDENFTGLKWFESTFGNLNTLNTLITKTINNGFHIYFKYNPLVKNKNNFKGLHIDILSDKKFVLEGKNYSILYNKPIRSLNDYELFILNLNFNDSPHSKFIDILNDIIINIPQVDSYTDWLNISFSIVDYCKVYDIDFNHAFFIFDNYSKPHSKYDSISCFNQFKISWDNYNPDLENRITMGTILKYLKESNLDIFNQITKKLNLKENKKIIEELDLICKTNKTMNIYNINHENIIKQNKKTIESSFYQNDSIEHIHESFSDNCSDPNLIAVCDSHNKKYCIKCTSCDFTYPKNGVAISTDIAPTIYNLIINNTINEDISNKDTLPVVEFILNNYNIIFSNNKFYLFNSDNGIYEYKHDYTMIQILNKYINTLKDDDYEFIKWFNKINYKENLIKELKTFTHIDTNIPLDSDQFLIGYNNGVFDLKTLSFRKGLPSEYITMSCGFDYDDSIDTTQIESILHDIFPINEDYIFMLNKLSLCLEGFNREQQIVLNYGHRASNGKSFIMELMSDSMGSYGATFPVNMLTSKMKTAGEADSTLSRFINKRFLYCSEPEANAKLNINLIKKLSGDKFTCRGLYEKEEKEYDPTFKMFICCNKLPAFDDYDNGIARRINIVEFSTKFCDNPKKKYEKQLVKYTNDEKKQLSIQLNHLLIKQYINLHSAKFSYSIPLKNKELHSLYLNDNNELMNQVQELLQERYEYSPNRSDVIKLKDIKQILKENDINIKDNVSIKNFVEDIFEGVEYRTRIQIDYKDNKNIFIYIKSKTV